MSKQKKPTKQPKPAAADDLAGVELATTDVAALVARFDEPEDAPPADGKDPEPDPILTIDELLSIEQRAIDGKWTRWPRLADAEFLLGDFVGHIQEQHRLERMAHLELEAKAKKAGKTYDPRMPLPIAIQRELEARARFGRAVKNWRGSSLASRPFNFQSFLELWTSSLDFRAFVNAKTIEIRGEIERETAELGKA